MKSVARISFALVACTLAGSVFAQTCPSASSQTITAAGSINGNTCPGGTGNTSVSAVCSGGTFLNGAGAVVYSLVLGATNSVSFSLQSTGTGATSACDATTNTCPFEEGLYVLNKDGASPATCGNQACLVTQQSGAQGTTVNGSLTANRAAGTYFIVVGDSGADNVNNPGCGPYTLTVSGTLPVKLQKFSVK